jgi:hypothetical protein
MHTDLNNRPAAILFFIIVFAVSALAQTLYEMPANRIESRMASGENPTGEKGKGGQANGGRKGAPTVPIKAGESRILAQANGTSGTVQRIWMTFPDRSPQMLRSLRIEMYWDGATTPAVSAPVGDFFGIVSGNACRFNQYSFPILRAEVLTRRFRCRSGRA